MLFRSWMKLREERWCQLNNQKPRVEKSYVIHFYRVIAESHTFSHRPSSGSPVNSSLLQGWSNGEHSLADASHLLVWVRSRIRIQGRFVITTLYLSRVKQLIHNLALSRSVMSSFHHSTTYADDWLFGSPKPKSASEILSRFFGTMLSCSISVWW